MTKLFECHLTLEPTFGDLRETQKGICETYGFKVAELLMQKAREETPVRSSRDAFCTKRSSDYIALDEESKSLCAALARQGFKVWRRKIEVTIIDEDYR